MALFRPRPFRILAGLALAALLTGAAATPAAPPRVALRFEASYPASLYWYLNALAGDHHVNVAAYRAHWRTVAGGLPSDESALTAFREVRDRYLGSFPQDGERENVWLPSPPVMGNDVGIRFAGCFLGSRTMDEAWLKASGLLTPPDMTRLRQAVAAVEPRFARQWRSWTYLDDYRKDYATYASQVDLAGMLGRAARFLGVPAGMTVDAPVTFVFTPPTQNTHGRKVGGNLIVEVVPGEKPVERVDVVAHEICHLLYEQAGLSDDPALIDAWYKAGGPATAGPALALLNEGVATAIGQGVATAALDPEAFARTRAKAGGWYADDRIDPYAKAIYPTVVAGMAGGKPLTGRAGDFLAAYRQAFGGGSSAPRNWLANYLLILPGRRDPVFAAYFGVAPPRSIFGATIGEGARDWRRWPGIAAVMGVTTAELPQLKAAAAGWGLDAAELARLENGEPGLHVETRAGGAPLFVVAAADRPTLGLALARFARLSEAAAGYTPLPPDPVGCLR